MSPRRTVPPLCAGLWVRVPIASAAHMRPFACGYAWLVGKSLAGLGESIARGHGREATAEGRLEGRPIHTRELCRPDALPTPRQTGIAHCVEGDSKRRQLSRHSSDLVRIMMSRSCEADYRRRRDDLM